MCITQNMVFVSLKVVKTIDEICHLLFLTLWFWKVQMHV
jgi:hypothetical protein